MIPHIPLILTMKAFNSAMLLVVFYYILLVKCGIGPHATRYLVGDACFLKIKAVTNCSNLESLLA